MLTAEVYNNSMDIHDPFKDFQEFKIDQDEFKENIDVLNGINEINNTSSKAFRCTDWNISKKYSVGPGENLEEVSSRTGINVATLIRINKLFGEQIHSGQVLELYSSQWSQCADEENILSPTILEKNTEPSKVVNKLFEDVDINDNIEDVEDQPKGYEVQPGDTLPGIALRTGISISTIKMANGLYNNNVYVGQKLRLSKPKPIAVHDQSIHDESVRILNSKPLSVTSSLSDLQTQLPPAIELASINKDNSGNGGSSGNMDNNQEQSSLKFDYISNSEHSKPTSSIRGLSFKSNNSTTVPTTSNDSGNNQITRSRSRSKSVTGSRTGLVQSIGKGIWGAIWGGVGSDNNSRSTSISSSSNPKGNIKAEKRNISSKSQIKSNIKKSLSKLSLKELETTSGGIDELEGQSLLQNSPTDILLENMRSIDSIGPLTSDDGISTKDEDDVRFTVISSNRKGNNKSNNNNNIYNVVKNNQLEEVVILDDLDWLHAETERISREKDVIPPNIIGQGTILTCDVTAALTLHLPKTLQYDSWILLYSVLENGADLSTFYSRVSGCRYSLIVVETTNGDIFGGFSDSEWMISNSFYGGGECFLFRVDEGNTITSYRWSQINDFFIWSNTETVAMGGGGGGFGFCLDTDFLTGSSEACETFRNPPLTKKDEEGSTFKVLNVEVYGFSSSLPRSAGRKSMVRQFSLFGEL